MSAKHTKNTETLVEDCTICGKIYTDQTNLKKPYGCMQSNVHDITRLKH